MAEGEANKWGCLGCLICLIVTMFMIAVLLIIILIPISLGYLEFDKVDFLF